LAARIMALENNLLKDKLTAYVQKMEENIINLEINKGIQ